MTLLPEPPFKSTWYKQSWISVAVLEPPLVRNGIIQRGAMILNQVDPLVERFPPLYQLFFLVERRGWCGVNESGYAHIKLVEDLSTWTETAQRFPDAVLLDLGPADFVDHTAFRPLSTPPAYDVVQIACWSPRKRIELMIEAAARLPHVSFLHLGHYEDGGTREELEYRAFCMDLIKRTGANITVPYSHCRLNGELPREKTEMNKWINQARLGLITTAVEGINRFKMECLAADRPVLVASDACTPTRKHVSPATGALYEPNPGDLAAAIQRVLQERARFHPRAYLLGHTGQSRSIVKLRDALATMCRRTGDRFRFDGIDWDGRNQSLVWGDKALKLLDDIVQEFSPAAVVT